VLSDDLLVVKGFNWEPYPANSGVTLGLAMMADFHFNIHSVNHTMDVKDLFTLNRDFVHTFQAFISIDPLLSLLDDTEVEYEAESITKISYDFSKKR